MFSQGSPWTSTRTSLGAIDASLRETLATLWNTFSFFTLYASINNFDPTDPEIPAGRIARRSTSGILSRLESVNRRRDDGLDGYESVGATNALSELIDDLSNWYVRRTRRRFWRTDPNAPRSDSLAAQATLLDVLRRVTLLLAPFCPFVAERPLRRTVSTSRRRTRSIWLTGPSGSRSAETSSSKRRWPWPGV